MDGLNPPPAEDGGEILAEHFRVLFEAIDRLDIHFVPPLYRSGDAVFVDLPDEFWGELTGSPTGTKHPWKEVLPKAGGLWEDGARSGTASSDPAYEANLSTANLAGKRAWFRRDRTSGEMRFILGACP